LRAGVGDHVDERSSICGLTVRSLWRGCRGRWDGRGNLTQDHLRGQVLDDNVPAERVRAYQVAADETGANRGYIVIPQRFSVRSDSRRGCHQCRAGDHTNRFTSYTSKSGSYTRMLMI